MANSTIGSPMTRLRPAAVAGRRYPVTEPARATADALADALASVLRGRRALLVASTDLSRYHDAATAARLDTVVLDRVRQFDADGLQRALDREPDHACGGGPTVAVMRAARAL